MRSKDDQDQGVGGPSLKTPDKGPRANPQKKNFNFDDFKSQIWTN